MAMLAVGALLLSPPRLATFSDSPSATKPANDSIALISGELRVIVTPPAYAGGRASESLNPTSVTALEGSRIQFEMPLDDRERAASSPSVSLQEPDGRTTPFEGDGSTARLEITATTSRPIVVRRTGPNGTVVDHLVHLRITRDEPPAVAIREPARDLIFAEGAGAVANRGSRRSRASIVVIALHACVRFGRDVHLRGG